MDQRRCVTRSGEGEGEADGMGWDGMDELTKRRGRAREKETRPVHGLRLAGGVAS